MEQSRCPAYLRRLTGISLAAAVMATTIAPAFAATPGSPTGSPSFSTRSIAKVMANTTPDTTVSRAPTTPDAPKTTQAQATKSGSFFKTRAGMLVIAVMAVGTGYAIYSAKEDRIRGSIR